MAEEQIVQIRPVPPSSWVQRMAATIMQQTARGIIEEAVVAAYSRAELIRAARRLLLFGNARPLCAQWGLREFRTVPNRQPSGPRNREWACEVCRQWNLEDIEWAQEKLNSNRRAEHLSCYRSVSLGVERFRKLVSSPSKAPP